MPRPIQGEYKKVGPGKWVKWNPVLMIRSTLEAVYNSSGKITAWNVRREQPRAVIDAVLERNVALQNDGKRRYDADLIHQQTSIPIAVHAQIMEQCGFQPGHGYDEKKFKQIINDRDNYKLKTVSGTI